MRVFNARTGRRPYFSWLFFGLLASTLSLAQENPDPATTDTAPAALEMPDQGELEEILVTARKRSEKLQDVPISISAFTAKGLRERNIQNAYDLANFTPNFQLTPNLGRRLDAPIVRGQFGPLIGGTAPNASFFVDGVYVTGSIGSTSVANLERIEVLRGPQSATFGRATFAGAVNYITRKPTNEYEGQVNALAGEDGQLELGAWGSGPLVEDKLYFYAGVNWDKWDGAWRNGLQPYDVVAGYSATGYPEIGINEPYGLDFFGPFFWDTNPQFAGDPPCLPSEPGGAGCAYTVGDSSRLGGTDTRIGTVKLTWDALETLQFNIKYERSEASDDHFSQLFVPPAANNNCFDRTGGGLTGEAGTAVDPRAGSRSGGWLCGDLNDSGFVSKLNIPNMARGVTVATPGAGGPQTSAPAPFIGLEETIDRYYAGFVWGVGEYEVTGRYARNDRDSEYVRDLDRSYALGPVATGLFEAYTHNEDLDDSVEVRLASPADGRWRWQLGYYWYDYRQETEQRNFNGFSDAWMLHPTGDQQVVNTAWFGSIEIDITEDWTFAFEGRYGKDEVSRTSPPTDLDNDPGTPDGTLTAEENFYSFSPRATLSWNILDDGSLTGYGQIAEGNKPGGFNFAYFDGDADLSRVDPADTIIKEEEAITYEIGLKGTYLDGELTANFSLFYIDWENQAINVLRCIPSLDATVDCEENNVVENAGESSVRGLELEMQWYPTDRQSYTLAYGYTDSTVDEYTDDEYAVLRCPETCYTTLPDSEELTPDAQALRNQLGDVGGNSAPRTPKHNLALSQIYRVPLAGELEWFVRNDLLYASKMFSTTSNLTWAPEKWEWNARLGLDSPRWSLSVYIDNITDEKSPTMIQDFPLFDLSQGYQGSAGVVYPNAFQLQPRRGRNAGIVASMRFGQS